jgi:hypothetical protein
MSNIAKMIAIAKRFGGGSGPSEVVILTETVLTVVEMGGATQHLIMTEPLAQVEVGKTYTVTYNGTAHETTASFDEGDGVYSLPFEDGGVALLLESAEVPGVGMAYGMVYAFDGSTPTTLSIVEKAETASAGGGMTVVHVNMQASSMAEAVDKTYDEVVAAIMAGQVVVGMFTGTGDIMSGVIVCYTTAMVDTSSNVMFPLMYLDAFKGALVMSPDGTIQFTTD